MSILGNLDFEKAVFTDDLKNKNNNIYGPMPKGVDLDEYYKFMSKDLLSIIAIKIKKVPGGLQITGDYSFIFVSPEEFKFYRTAGEQKTRIFRLTAATSVGRELISQIQSVFNENGMNDWWVQYYDEETHNIISLDMQPKFSLHL